MHATCAAKGEAHEFAAVLVFRHMRCASELDLGFCRVGADPGILELTLAGEQINSLIKDGKKHGKVVAQCFVSCETCRQKFNANS